MDSKVTKLIRLSLSQGNRFEIQLIQHENVQWIRITDTLGSQPNRFWSSKNGASSESVEGILLTLDKQIQEALTEDLLWDALTYWPEGWERWGPGIPKPIFDFIQSDSYVEQVNSFRAKE